MPNPDGSHHPGEAAHALKSQRGQKGGGGVVAVGGGAVVLLVFGTALFQALPDQSSGPSSMQGAQVAPIATLDAGQPDQAPWQRQLSSDLAAADCRSLSFLLEESESYLEDSALSPAKRRWYSDYVVQIKRKHRQDGC